MLGTDLKEIIFEYKERLKKKKSQMLENQNVRKPRREEKKGRQTLLNLLSAYVILSTTLLLNFKLTSQDHLFPIAS